MAELGTVLKAAREERGIALSEAAEATHIRQHLLEALEAGDYSAFPSPIVTRGLIRNYARYLNIDPIEALTLYDGKGVVPVKGQRLTSDGIEFMNLSMSPRPWITWDFILVILLVLAVVSGMGYLVYNVMLVPSLAAEPTPTSQIVGVGDDAALLLPTNTPLPSVTPTPVEPTATPTPLVYDGVTLEVELTQSSWIQIEVDDVREFEGVLQAGDRRSWTGVQRVAIRAGNAGGVRVIVNGQDRGPMGAEGQVVDQVWEKVEDPSLITPQPDTDLDDGPQAESIDTPTPTPASGE